MEAGRPGEVYMGDRRCQGRSLGDGLGRPEGEGREFEILSRKMAVERVGIVYSVFGSRT